MALHVRVRKAPHAYATRSAEMHHNAIVRYLAAVQEAERLCEGDQHALHLLQSLECWCPKDFFGLRTGCCGNYVYVPARSQK